MTLSTEVGNEIWLQPHPWLTLAELRRLIEEQGITATPRLGGRDHTHPKGYNIGQQTWLVLKDETGREQRRERIEITGLDLRPLANFDALSLWGCGFSYQSWLDIQHVLIFFEKRPIRPDETVTIVRFDYLDGSA